MPIYVYQAQGAKSCPHCTGPFELIQKINEQRLTSCPQCGAPVKRIITPPNLARAGPSLAEDNIEKHGFTRFRKVEKGVYEKTAGKGPDFITDKD